LLFNSFCKQKVDVVVAAHGPTPPAHPGLFAGTNSRRCALSQQPNHGFHNFAMPLLGQAADCTLKQAFVGSKQFAGTGIADTLQAPRDKIAVLDFYRTKI